MSEPRRPRAFRLDGAEVNLSDTEVAHKNAAGQIVIEHRADPYAAPENTLPPDEAAIEAAQKQGIVRSRWLSLGSIFWSALTGIFFIALGVWVESFVTDLFTRSQTLGAIGLALVAIALLALLILAIREIISVMRQRRIAQMHMALAKARIEDDRDVARATIKELAALYVARPETAKARTNLDELTREIVDGRDLIDIAERTLMYPLDIEVRREIATAAKRVSVVTAISPRALVDVLFVAAQTVRIIRRISEIYGGRPGLVGFFKLLRSVLAHLAITGGMAVGDSLVQQILGHGIAARLSARLGEGVLNGLLTTRVGISAMAVCRPMPFAVAPQPGVKDVAPFLFGDGKTD